MDPVTGVDTQSIENTWMRVKRKQKNKQESVGLYFQHIWKNSYGGKVLEMRH